MLCSGYGVKGGDAGRCSRMKIGKEIKNVLKLNWNCEADGEPEKKQKKNGNNKK